MKYWLSLAAILLFWLEGCKKKEDSPALLFVYPETNYFTAKSFDVLEFDIRGSSESALVKFSILSKPEASYSTVVFDTSFSSQKLFLVYQYQVPKVIETTKFTLEFVLNDDAGHLTRLAKIVTVSPFTKVPAETAGHEIFSSLSGKANAYNLASASPVFSSSSSAAAQQIMDATANDTLVAVDTLSRKWNSPAGLNFVRFNDFDYANATHTDMKQAYEVGLKKGFVDQISTGDIILTRLPNSDPDSGYVAIKLVYIIDDDSTDFDRYIFNLKK